MKIILQDNEKFDRKLEPSDWRFSASILGLIEYFESIDPLNDFHEIEDDSILYNSNSITKEKYLNFVEKRYGQDLHHKFVEDRIKYFSKTDNDEIDSEKIKEINEKLSGNTIMKKVFKKIKFNGDNKDEILSLIESNRENLICETFRNKKDMYANFCNTNQMFNDDQNYCRLLGYCIDAGKKGKSIGYAFNANSFSGQDICEFDFIPFAFINDRESIFINDNYEINRLSNAKKILEAKIKDDSKLEGKYKSARYSLFKGIIESSDFIDYDVEVIVKNRDKDYFETLYIRKPSIEILRAIGKSKIDYNSLCFSYKITDDYYIDIYRKVIDSILNNILLDEIIDLLLKDNRNNYKINQLLRINDLIRSEAIMNSKKVLDAKTVSKIHACAKEVKGKIQENKLESYRQKLISSIIFKDYDRVCQILLQLSQYSDTYFSFADDLFIDFEENKDIAYMFINALGKSYELSDKSVADTKLEAKEVK